MFSAICGPLSAWAPPKCILLVAVFPTWCRHVTLGVAAPDCWERQVLLVNGQLGPTLEVVQGEELQVRGTTCRTVRLSPASTVPARFKCDLMHHVPCFACWPHCDQRSPQSRGDQFSLPHLSLLHALNPPWQLTLHNDLPSDWPNVHPGLSIHWHGFDMKGYPCEEGL